MCDCGCGGGNSSKFFAESGLQCDAFDASIAMVESTRANCPDSVTVEHKAFHEWLPEKDIYDGIWASNSLLHTKRSDFATLLAVIHSALKVGGAFYLGMKLGDGEHRDSIGRHYSYFTEDELRSYLKSAHFRWDTHETGWSVGADGSNHEWIKIIAFAED